MRVLAHEPYPDNVFVEQQRITLVPLDQLLIESDFVSLHVPLSNDSRRLIDARTLALMKPTAFLINTARGGLVNEEHLADALRQKKIAGAGLDVFIDEPPAPDHPLRTLDNVLCTAHTAGIDLQARDDMAMLAAGAIVALRRGEWPERQVVNPDCRSRFHWTD